MSTYVSAATVVVTNTGDSGPGTLRNAIQFDAVNGDTITFDPSINGTPITFASRITVTKDLTIIGNDTTNTILSGGGTTQLFHVDGDVTFERIKFQEADDPNGGSCIEVDQTSETTVRECSFVNSTGNFGAGIYVYFTGQLNVSNSYFGDNSIDVTNWGGAAITVAFGDAGTNVIIDSCTFHNNYNTANTAGTDGGAIFALGGNLQISNSTFTNNTVEKFPGDSGGPRGGAILARGTSAYAVFVTISDCLFENNQSIASNTSGSRGGALCVQTEATVSILRTTFRNNSCVADAQTIGGAIFSDVDNGITIEDCEFENNSVSSTSGTSFGGAILHQEDVMTITRSSFHGNTATSGSNLAYGGAIHSTSGSEITNILNSTFYNNGTTATNGTFSQGGALGLNSNTSYNITNNTVVNNYCIAGSGTSQGGGMAIERATNWDVRNNIFADNSAVTRGNDVYVDTYGGAQPTTSIIVGNIVEDEFGYPGTFAYTTDPGMDPAGIQDNGGLTPTVAVVNPISDAVDNAIALYAPSTDQRGGLRNGNADIGAYELNACFVTTASIAITACETYTVPSGDETYTMSGTFMDTIPNTAGCDSIITIDLTINYNSTFTDVITACDSYLWIDGNTYTTSNNTATHIIPNAAGCDSTITLDLTVNYASAGTDIVSACDSYTWIDGNTYSTSTSSPTFTLTNAVGCDSLVTLNLTINNSNTGTDVQTACDSFTWIDGNTYTASTNTPTFTLTNAAGCDSVVTLDLTINNSNTGTDVQVACDSFTWIDGITYTASTTTPTFTLTNIAGCDSLVTLNLTINNASASTEVVTACDSFTWIDGNTYTNSTNSPTVVFTNAVGCDSTITLDLTINNSTIGTDVVTACDSFTWIDGNTYTSSTNTPTFTLTNAVGCDSLVTLDLTINVSTTGTDVITACEPYTWIDGNTYAVDTIGAMFTITNVYGCDSIVTLELSFHAVDVNTTLSDLTITADASNSTYQWVDCDNNFAPISGETAQSFTATMNGNYAVIVNDGICSDTSSCTTINNVSTDEISTDLEFQAYPNPTNGEVTISAGEAIIRATVYDMKGATLQTSINHNAEKTVIDMSDLVTGVYMVSVITESGITRNFRIIRR
ncbi:MAG: T9SS type A sorting domain-containing protein [Fluviicola sp.]